MDIQEYQLTKISEIEPTRHINPNDILLVSLVDNKITGNDDFYSKKISFQSLSASVLSSTLSDLKIFKRSTNLSVDQIVSDVSDLSSEFELSSLFIVLNMLINWTGSISLYNALSSIGSNSVYYDGINHKYRNNVIYYIVDTES